MSPRRHSVGGVFVRFFIGFIGLVLIALGSYRLYHEASIMAKGVETEVSVIDVDVKTSSGARSGSTTTYTPIVEIETAEGTHVRVAAKDHRLFVKPEPGDRVTVLYDPDKPTDAIIPGRESWIILPLFLGVGVIFLLVALGRWPFFKHWS